MSTQIANINTIDGKETLHLIQFYGGTKHGLCLTIGGEWRIPYARLNKQQVQQLVRELQNWLGETELAWGKSRYNKEQLRKFRKQKCEALGLTEDEGILHGIISDEII